MAVCADISQNALFDLASTSMNLRWKAVLQKIGWLRRRFDQGAARFCRHEKSKFELFGAISDSA
jgi:hypothetical protein